MIKLEPNTKRKKRKKMERKALIKEENKRKITRTHKDLKNRT